ncbi:acyl carrier protein, partial [Streptomyces sp. NPDC059853]|uniref:acyl carrier protein n=1 Tax=Streptomyces sp. NPDC059853 TaxID=3346973 RepID=UPI0036534FFE
MATNEEILADLRDIVAEIADVVAADVTLEKSFVDDLDIDSLSLLEIVVQAEDRFGVKIPDDEMTGTVDDAVRYIAAHQSRPPRVP